MLFAEVGRLVRHSQLSEFLDPLGLAGMLSCASALEEELLAAEFPLDDDLADPGDANTSKHDFVILAEAYRCAGLLKLYHIFPALLRKRLRTDDPTCDWPSFGFSSPCYEAAHEAADVVLWIDSLALHILDLLVSLPASLGTCCLQPMLELIREVWRQLDAGEDTFWMDVMMKNGWQTVMG